MPFLQNVTRGRGVPDERLAEVAEHYQHFGGVSPITAQNRALLAALGAEFAARGIDLPVYCGNRNWHPMLTDTVAADGADGRRHALVLATSAYGGYSACRQYRRGHRRAPAPRSGRRRRPPIAKLRHFFDHPGSSPPTPTRCAPRWPACPGRRATTPGWCSPRTRSRCRWPTPPGPAGGRYLAQHRETARLVAGGRGRRRGLRPGVAVPVRPAAGAVAGAGHQRPPAGAGRRGRAGRGGAPDRVRLRPPRGGLGPGQRGPRHRRASSGWSSPGRARPAPTRRSWRD